MEKEDIRLNFTIEDLKNLYYVAEKEKKCLSDLIDKFMKKNPGKNWDFAWPDRT